MPAKTPALLYLVAFSPDSLWWFKRLKNPILEKNPFRRRIYFLQTLEEYSAFLQHIREYPNASLKERHLLLQSLFLMLSR